MSISYSLGLVTRLITRHNTFTATVLVAKYDYTRGEVTSLTSLA